MGKGPLQGKPRQKLHRGVPSQQDALPGDFCLPRRETLNRPQTDRDQATGVGGGGRNRSPFWSDGGSGRGGLLTIWGRCCFPPRRSSASPELPSPCRDVNGSPGPPSHRRRFPGGAFSYSVGPSTTVACLALRQTGNCLAQGPSFGAGKSCLDVLLFIPSQRLSELRFFSRQAAGETALRAWHLTKRGAGGL